MTQHRFHFALVTLAVALGLAAVCSKTSSQGPNDFPLKAPSVWSGRYMPAGDKVGFPMVVFLRERNKHDFSATTWYPTFGNGLLKAVGRVEFDGKVLLREDEVIHSTAVDLGPGNYVGRIEGKIWPNKA
jgi:hypothetical protein